MYTSRQLGEGLKENLTDPYDPIRVAKWADSVHFNHCLELPQELYDIVTSLSPMSFGPEFEYSKEELLILAEKLIDNEKGLLEKLYNHTLS
ncbi:MAG TPA: hypothetical protein VJK48_03755 [Chlamydiales bacterium]|nr:hypothetical protein [Chlamydiales bacterium]